MYSIINKYFYLQHQKRAFDTWKLIYMQNDRGMETFFLKKIEGQNYKKITNLIIMIFVIFFTF